MKALVVDNSVLSCQEVNDLLHKHFPGILVEETENMIDAQRFCTTFKPDLILIDSNTLRLSGMAALAEIKEFTPQVIIIIFTDFLFAEYRNDCLEIGANDLVYKGEKGDGLIGAIHQALKEGPNVGALHHKKSRADLLVTPLHYNHQQCVESLTLMRVNAARKEEALTAHEEILYAIWQNVMPMLGRVTLIAILERTCSSLRQEYPFIAELKMTDEGFSFHALADHLAQIDLNDLRKGLQELIINFVTILVHLMGGTLMRQLIQEIELKRLN